MSIEVLLLRFDAPLMSFGGPTVDEHNVTLSFPGRSLLTGLFANSLGWTHADAEKLERLQDRIRHGVRCDREGLQTVDYQTVDLGQEFMDGTRYGWTTRGVIEGRKGGEAKEGTHIRYRHYLADAVYTVAVSLEPADEPPTLGQVAASLQEPARPLFIGRKCCLPAAPIALGLAMAPSLREALQSASPIDRVRRTDDGHVRAWWDRDDAQAGGHAFPITDTRDWANQVHSGRRIIVEGVLELPLREEP